MIGIMEIGEKLNLKEIETAFSQFKICPKCNSTEGFWLGLEGAHAFVQCKGCGAKFELFEIYKMREKNKNSQWLKFLRN